MLANFVRPVPMITLPQNGLVAFVKHSCPTCTQIEPVLQQVAQAVPQFSVVTQDDPQFPDGVARLIDDRELDHSYVNAIEFVPTLISFEEGREKERIVGWDRAAWQRLTGVSGLGADLPALRPG
jgi:thiol-disulfide isomerase/thioredoxin